MKIKAFLLLPETDAAFEVLHQNPDAYSDLIKELYAIKRKLKEHKDFQLYYDSSNIESFLQVATGLVPEPYLKGINGQLLHILKYVSTDVKAPVFRNPHHTYANWQISVLVERSQSVIAECAESRKIDDATQATVCICLGNSILTNRDDVHVIKDFVKDNELPVLITVNLTNSDVSFVKWLTTISNEIFSLKNHPDYEPLDKFWRKERIYRHTPTGNHWYFDYFHKENKVHYEVFDSTGDVYLGEADKNGNLIPDTDKNHKKISKILKN